VLPHVLCDRLTIPTVASVTDLARIWHDQLLMLETRSYGSARFVPDQDFDLRKEDRSPGGAHRRNRAAGRKPSEGS